MRKPFNVKVTQAGKTNKCVGSNVSLYIGLSINMLSWHFLRHSLKYLTYVQHFYCWLRLSPWRCRPLILNWAAHYNSQFCVCFHYCFVWCETCLFFPGESLHTNNHYTVYFKEKMTPTDYHQCERGLQGGQIVLVYLSFQLVLRDRDSRLWTPQNPLSNTFCSLQKVLPEKRGHLNNQPPKCRAIQTDLEKKTFFL